MTVLVLTVGVEGAVAAGSVGDCDVAGDEEGAGDGVVATLGGPGGVKTLSQVPASVTRPSRISRRLRRDIGFMIAEQSA
jgi:hypothetical protein